MREDNNIDSQESLILQHLQDGYKITSKMARRLFGCFTLAQRIHDLKLKGHSIDSVLVRRYNGNNEYQGVHSEYRYVFDKKESK